jgi:hypothetical protein
VFLLKITILESPLRVGLAVRCIEGQYACAEKCIQQTWRCDGAADCANAEDELGCRMLF